MPPRPSTHERSEQVLPKPAVSLSLVADTASLPPTITSPTDGARQVHSTAVTPLTPPLVSPILTPNPLAASAVTTAWGRSARASRLVAASGAATPSEGGGRPGSLKLAALTPTEGSGRPSSLKPAALTPSEGGGRPSSLKLAALARLANLSTPSSPVVAASSPPVLAVDPQEHQRSLPFLTLSNSVSLASCTHWSDSP